MSKLNYSATCIKHVLAEHKNRRTCIIEEFVEKTNIVPKYAFGDIYFQIDDLFTAENNGLHYSYKGYGGVNILGNINGLTHQRLFYKNASLKTSFERLTSALQYEFDESREVLQLIKEQHGAPNVQIALLT